MARSLVKQDAIVEVREEELDLPCPADPDAVYSVRWIPPSENERVRAKHVPKRWDKRTHQQVEQDATAEQGKAVIDDLLDYCLIGWSGVVDNGSQVPCERENKLALPRPVKISLVEFALMEGASRQERQKQSFREPARVGDVLDRASESRAVLSNV